MQKLICSIFISICIAIVFVRLYVGEVCTIPSDSMAQTILPGDWLWINKTTYGAKLPESWNDIPLFNIITWIIPSSLCEKKIEWNNKRIKGKRLPREGDIIVFNSLEINNIVLAKRIVAVPGDSFQIKRGTLYSNKRFLIQPMTIIPSSRELNRLSEYPRGTKWTEQEYGPVYLPRRGDKITITNKNYIYLAPVIQAEGGTVSFNKNKCYINGFIDSVYCFKYNYYFVMGDNRNNSRDSRSFGFVSEDKIIGILDFILFSIDSEKCFWKGFRWNRFFSYLAYKKQS